MKKLFTYLVAILLFASAQSQTYYLDPVKGSNDYTSVQAQNPATPWKNFAATRKHDLEVNAGMRFSLKGGQYGPDMVSYNGIPMPLYAGGDKGWKGTELAPIVIEAQQGETPVFTTYKTATNPVAVRGKRNIFAYQVDAFEEISVVEIDGYVRSCGRWPKRTETGDRGYLMGREKSGGGYNQTATIKASFIPDYDLVGGDVVVRNSEYIVSVHPITAQRPGEIDFYNMAEAGIEAGFGTYFQNHLNLLSQNNEWAYKRSTKTLYVYFADGTPKNHTVRYASSNFGAWVLQGAHIQFKGIRFEGANIHAVKLQFTENIRFDACHFIGAGRKAIWQVNEAKSTEIRNSTVKHCLAGGFDLGREANTVIENNTFDSISVFNTRPTWNAEVNGKELKNIMAEGICGDAVIIAEGNNSKINSNIIRFAGFNGINWNGASTIVNGNYIKHVQLRGTDGSGIYSYNKGFPDRNYKEDKVRTISNNTILHVVGDPGGTANNLYSPVFGIYNDDEVNRVNVTNNTIGHATRAGIYNHHTQYIAASNNNIFNCEYGYYTRYGDNSSEQLPVENTFTNDLVVSNKSGQILNSFTVIQQGVFSSVTPEQTATMKDVAYSAYNDKQERALLYNPLASATLVSYSGKTYTNIQTEKTIENPVQLAAYSSVIGYRAIAKRSSAATAMNEGFAEMHTTLAKLTIAPNPVYNTLAINFPGNADPMTVTILDFTGRKMIASANFTTNYQLDFSKHPKGAYIVLITNSNNRSQERRVIIKK